MRTADPSGFDLFISYATADDMVALAKRSYSRAATLKRVLETHCHPEDGRRFRVCTFDDDFEIGHGLSETIRSNLGESKALLVLCTPAAAESNHVKEEVATYRSLCNGSVLVAPLGGNPSLLDIPSNLGLGPNLRHPSSDSQLDVKRRFRRESHKVVASVWGLALNSVEARFRRAARRRKQVVATLLLLAMIMAAVPVVLFNSSIGFHPVTRFVDDGRLRFPRSSGFMPDGERLFAAVLDQLLVWNGRDQEPIDRFQLPGLIGRAAVVGPETIAVSVGTELLGLDVTSGNTEQIFQAPEQIKGVAAGPGALAVMSDGRLYVRRDGEAFQEAPRPDVTVGKQVPEAFRKHGPLRFGETLAWDPKGVWLAAASQDGQLVVVRPDTWEFLESTDALLYEVPDTRMITDLAFDPQGERLFFLERGSPLNVVRLADGTITPFQIEDRGLGLALEVLGRDASLVVATTTALEWYAGEERDFAHQGSSRAARNSIDAIHLDPARKTLLVVDSLDGLVAYKRTLRVFGLDVISW